LPLKKIFWIWLSGNQRLGLLAIFKKILFFWVVDTLFANNVNNMFNSLGVIFLPNNEKK
jgi:hypothetical protein